MLGSSPSTDKSTDTMDPGGSELLEGPLMSLLMMVMLLSLELTESPIEDGMSKTPGLNAAVVLLSLSLWDLVT
jgi:hypothetical protein